MSNKSGKFMLVLALVAVLAMFMAMASVSFAGGDEPTNGAKVPTVCVSGYVINHREQPVDGTKLVVGTDPVTGDPVYLTVKAEGTETLGGPVVFTDDAAVGANGSYTFKDMPAGLYYNFTMQLPTDWDGIVPAAAARRHRRDRLCQAG